MAPASPGRLDGHLGRLGGYLEEAFVRCGRLLRPITARAVRIWTFCVPRSLSRRDPGGYFFSGSAGPRATYVVTKRDPAPDISRLRQPHKWMFCVPGSAGQRAGQQLTVPTPQGESSPDPSARTCITSAPARVTVLVRGAKSPPEASVAWAGRRDVGDGQIRANVTRHCE